ncbi:MAG: aminotransferase class IV [Phycisphaerales bacterium]
MPTTIFQNGHYLSPEGAKLSALDAGIQHAVGVFTTLLAGCGSRRPEPVDISAEAPIEGVWAVDLDDHLDRLVVSAMELGLAEQLNPSALAEALTQTVARSNLPRARVRLTLTGGDLNLLHRDGKPVPRMPTVLIVAQPATVYPDAMLQRGVLATLSATRPSPLDRFIGHKTLNYWWRLYELQVAAKKNAGEALVFDSAARLIGGCVSNAFIVKGDHVYTPPSSRDDAGTPGESLPSATLPGITRQWAIHELAGRGTIVQKRHLTIDDVLSADELFLTNSSWGVLPVTQVESRKIGPGTPGSIAQELVQRWARNVASLAGE